MLDLWYNILNGGCNCIADKHFFLIRNRIIKDGKIIRDDRRRFLGRFASGKIFTTLYQSYVLN